MVRISTKQFVSLTLFFFTAALLFNFHRFFNRIEIDQQAYDFSLQGIHQEKVMLHQYAGKFVLLFFGYTRCSGICSLSLHTFQKISANLPKGLQDQVFFLFVSIDPKNDSLKNIQDYLANFPMKNLHGLTSGQENSIEVAKKYFNFSLPRNHRTGDIHHRGFIYLIGPKLELKSIYKENVEYGQILNDLLRLAKEKIS